MKYLIIIFLIFSFNLSANWKTIESKHFKLSYETQFDNMAEKSIEYLENIHNFVSFYLNNLPNKTNIVISDTVDDANGFARTIPYNLIHIYPFAPESTSELGNYSNWLYELLLHEYVHIVQITKMSELHKFINKIFGTTVMPNQVLPKWIIEGIAVYFESIMTSYGRLNSSYYKMIFRTSMYYKNISLSELSNITNYYPYGGLYYLYGAFFIDYVFKNNPNFNYLSKFIENYGNNLIPYGINASLKNVSRRTFTDLYDDFTKYYKDLYENLYKKLEQRGFTQFEQLLPDTKYEINFLNNNDNLSKSVSSIYLSKNNILYINTASPENSAYIYKYENNKITKFKKFDKSSSGFEIIDDYIFYIYYSIFENKYVKRLKFLNLKTSNEETLIDNMRIINFKINNYDCVITANETGIQNLYSYNLKNKKILKLTDFKHFSTIDKATFINDDEIVFSANEEGSFWDLYKLNIRTGHFEKLTNDNYYDISPVFAKDENKIYFISDREDDILNIYSLDLKTKAIYKKTNFFSGLKQIEYDSENKIFYALHFQKENAFEVIKIKKDNLIDEISVSLKFDDGFTILKNNEKITFEKKDFSVFPEIMPKNYSPQISSNNFENNISLEISNGDVRDFWFYSSFISYYFDLEDILFSFYISNSENMIYYSLGYSYTPIINENFIVNGERQKYFAQYHSFSTSFGIPFFDYNGSSQLYFSAGYNYYTFSKLEYEFKPYDTIPVLPIEYDRMNFSFGYYFGNTKYLINTPGSSDGNSLNIQARFTEKDLYSKINVLSFGFQLKQYYPLEFLNGAFAFRYSFFVSYSTNGVFNMYLGGYPDTGSLTDSLIDRTSISGLYLRGYPANYFHSKSLNLANLEYRQKLFDANIGYSTIPVYIQQFYLRFFYDVASINDKFYEIDTFHGIGSELTMQFYLGYLQQYNLSFGYSYGFNKGGENQIYLNFTGLY